MASSALAIARHDHGEIVRSEAAPPGEEPHRGLEGGGWRFAAERRASRLRARRAFRASVMTSVAWAADCKGKRFTRSRGERGEEAASRRVTTFTVEWTSSPSTRRTSRSKANRAPATRPGFACASSTRRSTSGAVPISSSARSDIFVTHAHLDHAVGIPFYAGQRQLHRMTGGRVYVPADAAEGMREIMTIYERITGAIVRRSRGDRTRAVGDVVRLGQDARGARRIGPRIASPRTRTKSSSCATGCGTNSSAAMSARSWSCG